MNRKLGHLIKAALFALPLALPGVALAQSADTNSNTNNPPVQNDTSKGSLDQDTTGNSNAQGSSGMNSGGTLDQTDKQNAGSLGTTPSNPDTDTNPPAGKLDNSGSSTSSDRGVGGDINKDTSNMDTTTTTHKKIKKSVKKSSRSDLNNDTSNDVNR